MMLTLALSVGEFFSWIGYIIVALLCLMFMIIVHEAGHYAAGKIFGFSIIEFSIGFGPKIFQRKNKKTGELFLIRCIPLGGYCQFEGEDEEVPDENVVKEKKDPSTFFNAKPAWQRIIVLFAGAFMNLVSAIIIISIFFMAYGDFLPKVTKLYQSTDEAYIHEFEIDDVIYKIDGKNCYSLIDPSKVNNLFNDGNSHEVIIIRDGKQKTITISKHEFIYLEDESESEVVKDGYGISITFEKTKIGFFKSIGHAFEFVFNVIALIFKTFGHLFTGQIKASESLGGTVTAISALAELSKNGFAAIMYGVCVLSASIGVMNLMPIPALDGCRIIFCIIEMIRRKPLNRKIEGIINFIGLIFLFALAIIFDLLHFFG